MKAVGKSSVQWSSKFEQFRPVQSWDIAWNLKSKKSWISIFHHIVFTPGWGRQNPLVTLRDLRDHPGYLKWGPRLQALYHLLKVISEAPKVTFGRYAASQIGIAIAPFPRAAMGPKLWSLHLLMLWSYRKIVHHSKLLLRPLSQLKNLIWQRIWKRTNIGERKKRDIWKRLCHFRKRVR